MFGIGTGELLVLALVALLVLGPERMPKLARDAGRVMADLRRTSDDLRDQFMNADLVAPPPAIPPVPASVPEPAPAPAVPAGETAFDRDLREARERLAESAARNTPPG